MENICDTSSRESDLTLVDDLISPITTNNYSLTVANIAYHLSHIVTNFVFPFSFFNPCRVVATPIFSVHQMKLSLMHGQHTISKTRRTSISA